MLCLEVVINGEQRVCAGVEMAQTLNVSVTAHPGFNQAWVHVNGEIVPEGQPTADAHWLTSSAAIGDIVQIRLIESANPTKPSIGRSNSQATPVPTDGIPFVCGFCGKEPKDVESMLSGRKAMICRECLRDLHAIDCEEDAKDET
jgi:hypothetical protein